MRNVTRNTQSNALKRYANRYASVTPPRAHARTRPRGPSRPVLLKLQTGAVDAANSTRSNNWGKP